MQLFVRSLCETSFLELQRRESPIAFIGVPLDESSSYRSGARWGPEAVRRASRSLELCFDGDDECVLERVGIDDLGDVVLAPGDLRESIGRIERVMVFAYRELRKRFVVVVGGEHTITLGAVRGVKSSIGSPCLVVMDAHLDLRSEYLGSSLNHATVMKRVVDEGTIDRVVWIGVRAYSRDELEELKRLELQGIAYVLWRRECLEHTPFFVASRAVSFLKGCDCVYVSLDMDVIDPSYAPGVQTPEPLGLEPQWIINVLRRIVEYTNVVGLDIVELSPPNDPGEQTAFLASRIIVEVLKNVVKKMEGARW